MSVFLLVWYQSKTENPREMDIQIFVSSVFIPFSDNNRLAGLVVKASDPGFESRLRRDFSGSSPTSDFKIGTPVAALPGILGSALGLVGPVSV